MNTLFSLFQINLYQSDGSQAQFSSATGAFPLKIWMYVGIAYNFQTGMQKNQALKIINTWYFIHLYPFEMQNFWSKNFI
jgi:hypothetical protein